jgi:hypothetical protein
MQMSVVDVGDAQSADADDGKNDVPADVREKSERQTMKARDELNWTTTKTLIDDCDCDD